MPLDQLLTLACFLSNLRPVPVVGFLNFVIGLAI
jgi:hypothetical protein